MHQCPPVCGPNAEYEAAYGAQIDEPRNSLTCLTLPDASRRLPPACTAAPQVHAIIGPPRGLWLDLHLSQSGDTSHVLFAQR